MTRNSPEHRAITDMTGDTAHALRAASLRRPPVATAICVECGYSWPHDRPTVCRCGNTGEAEAHIVVEAFKTV